jgi:hypothetical protein
MDSTFGLKNIPRTFGLKNIPRIFTPSLLLFGKFFLLTNYYPFKA